MNLPIKLRILTPVSAMIFCVFYSLFFYDISIYLTLINVSFVIGILLLSMSAMIYISNGWFQPLYHFMIRRKKPSKEQLNESLVDYQIASDVIKEKEKLRLKKQNLRKESILLPLITAITLMITSFVVLFIHS
ncbi:DUF3899 domain-containing protein [Chengkuizengella sediminis]|uniref:DUF3899 domain-containing protein n=1 Tax=Chengkuizengella sediminis TaxID=1885917 RepID=UPI00138A006C|nr:DUF3899 domain-containing protein [Chengkuizengella sediminis]NDI36193.1 DUF3899 domain-containing protein [Chengkuizengella sediminis]